MKILFVHQNFPAQFRYLAAVLARSPGWEVVALGETENVKRRERLPGVKLIGYAAPQGANQRTHHYVRHLEGAVRRAQAVTRACLDLKKRGFFPDVIYAHPGWGESMFLKDVFPDARLTLYCEFYYRAKDHDVGFDPEYPAGLDDALRVRIKNAANLLSIETADGGISPTQWQRNAFPDFFQKQIEVVHEGIDTDIVCPDPDAEFGIGSHKRLKLTRKDEVITYIARNLEPYRGFHVFMRALPEILKQRPNAQVLIVGADGVSYGQSLPKGQTYRKKLMDEVGTKIDDNRVHFLGQVPYNSLLKIYQISSTHVYLTYPFVLSWSILEMMAAGGVVIGSRTPPVEEVIMDGKNGYLTDFFDQEALAAKIGEVLDNPKKNEAIREAARKTVVEKFDLKRVCLPRHLELLGVKTTKLDELLPPRARM